MTIDAAFKIQMDSEGPKVRNGAGDPTGEFDVLLERVRARLGVMAAVLRLDGMATIVAHDQLVDTAHLLGATAFCDHAMALGRPLVVPDATQDAGFASDPTVTGAPYVRFFVGIPLFGPSGEAIGILALFDTVPRSQVAAKRLAGLAEDVTAGLGDGDNTATIARQKLALQAQRQVIREQAAMMSARSAAFDRASAAARIGMWECDLRTEKLDWSDGLYGIFDIPQGMYPDRRRTLACYTEPSRRTLEHLRGTAIAQQTGFQMDAEITSMLGRSRWIRLTATVESRFGKAIRIFGMKQDITEEKLLSDQTRYLAEFDVMTGLANRSQFQSRIAEWGTLHPDRAPIGALLLIDLDGFKQVNDNFGHELGDECLRQAATRLAEVCRGTELVARVGGDEFAVLVGTSMNRRAIVELAANIVKTLRISVHPRQSMTIGASVGIALSDDCAPADLFGKADMALYAAKAAGKNTYRMFGLDGQPA